MNRKDLKEFSVEQLQDEIKRRNAALSRPQVLAKPDYDDLMKSVIDHLDDIEAGTEDDDSQHYLYETLLEAFYGTDIWKWINTQT
jgi:Holliday junction resolvase RusA-like endonuclease